MCNPQYVSATGTTEFISETLLKHSGTELKRKRAIVLREGFVCTSSVRGMRPLDLEHTSVSSTDLGSVNTCVAKSVWENWAVYLRYLFVFSLWRCCWFPVSPFKYTCQSEAKFQDGVQYDHFLLVPIDFSLIV